MKARMRYALVAVVAGAIVAAAVSWNKFRPLRVTVTGIERNVPVRVFGLGTVEAQVISRIGFEVGATLHELTVDHGDQVRRGDVLARLQDADQQAKLAKARAGLLSAEMDVRKAEANAQKARANLAQKQTANKRKQALVGRSVVSEQTAEEAKRDEDVAVAELAVAVSEIEVAKSRLAEARASESYETAVLSRHVLTAPFDAIVVERHRELGTVVRAGDPIYTLLAPQTVWALAYVDEARAGPLREGQEAEVLLRSLPQNPFRARVVRIGIESDRVNEERRVWVKCEQCPTRIHLGEQAEIRITVAVLEKARLVPEAAVTDFDGGRGTVWTVENGQLNRRTTTFRHRTEDARLEVIDGLPPGAEIVTAIVPGLREGRAAQIAKARTP